MQGHKEVIERLNGALLLELGAINQYWLHYRLLADWGVAKLAAKERAESIEEMHHADKLIERILFLGGHPNLQQVGALRIGQTVEEVLKADLEGEFEALDAYRAARLICEDKGDAASKKLFEDLILDEEGHVDFLETQLALLESIGIERYIQLNAEAAE